MGTILNSSKNALPKNKRPSASPKMLVFFVTAILLTIPLNYGFSSIAVIIFAVYTIFTARKENFSVNTALILPVLLFMLMVASLAWSVDFKCSMKALSREITLLAIPVLFCLSRLWKKQQRDILKYYSFGMVIYGAFYIIRALARYTLSGDTDYFFYHSLVTKDVNAIYASVFFAVAVFYYLSKKKKSIFDYFAFAFLFTLIFLLSSKNIVIITVLITGLYLLIFSGFTKKAKWLLGIVFFTGIVVAGYYGKIKDRFEAEFNPATEQAVTDLNSRPVTVYEAWNKKTFSQNDYFNGTAMRIYQVRIFTEMLEKDNIFLSGYGLNASQVRVEQKGVEHNVFQGDENNIGYNKLNFHNQYIEVFADLGILGLLLLLAMLGINLKNGIINKDFVHIAFAILMIALFLTESFIWRQRGVIFFTVLYCLFNKGLYTSVIERSKR